MPQSLYPWRKSPQYPLDRRLGSLDMEAKRRIPDPARNQTLVLSV